MGGKWSPSRNNCYVGVFFDDNLEFSADGSQARVKNVRLRFKSTVAVTESSNSWDWSGGVLVDGDRGTFSFSGSGERTVQTLTGQWQTLSYGGSTTATYTARAIGINYAGGTLTVSGSVTYPARAVSKPATPTGMSAARVLADGAGADKQHQVSWQTAPTAAAPITNVIVERQEGAETATPISVATLAGTAKSWVDSTTAENSRYRWRAKTRNAAGDSVFSGWSAWIATTPAAPVGLTAVKDGSTITLGWANGGPYRTGSPIEHSIDGGTVYAAEATAAAAAVTYADTGLDTGVTHRYRIRHAITGVPLASGGTTTLYSAWVQSQIVQLSAPPNAPLVHVPAVRDAELNSVMIGVTHQSADSTAQTAGEVRYRPLTGSWSTVSIGTSAALVVPAGTWTNGLVYEVQARTKGQHPDWSPWSMSALVVTSGTPSVTILSPMDGESITTSSATYLWTFHDPDGGGQVSWEARLLAGSTTVETASGSGDTTRWTPSSALANGSTYTGQVRGRDTDGLWSEWVGVTNPVNFLPPPMPGMSASFDPEEGSVEIGVEIPPPVDGVEVEAVAATVERWTDDRWVTLVDHIPVVIADSGLTPDDDGLYLADGLNLTPDPTYDGLYLLDGIGATETYPGLWALTAPVSVAYTDPIPPLATEVTYRVTSWSAEDTSVTDTITVATTGSRWIFLNGGPGWTALAKVLGNVDGDFTTNRAKSLVRYAGRRLALERIGPGRDQSVRLSGVVGLAADTKAGRALSTWAAWLAVADLPAPICYRNSWDGERRFVSIGEVSRTFGAEVVSISTSLTEVPGDG